MRSKASGANRYVQEAVQRVDRVEGAVRELHPGKIHESGIQPLFFAEPNHFLGEIDRGNIKSPLLEILTIPAGSGTDFEQGVFLLLLMPAAVVVSFR